MTLADALLPQALLPASPAAWAAALLLAAAVLAARQWAFSGLFALAATLPGARPASDAEHRGRVRRADAERLAFAAPLLFGAVGALTASFADLPFLLLLAAAPALLCILGTARFCLQAFGPPGLLPAGAAVAVGAGAFVAGALLGTIALPLVILREGVWTPHLLLQAPVLGARRLAGAV